ncbi:MAG: hypothetical protein WBP56_17570 [Polyangia bacterium]
MSNALNVAVDRQALRRKGRLDHESLFFEQGVVIVDRATNHIVQFEWTALQLDLITRDAREVEQIVHQARQLDDLSADDVKGALGLFGARRRMFENVQAVANGRERVAQFV